MRHSIQYTFLAGVSALALLSAPAFAQECEQEISRAEDSIASSDMSESDRATAQEQLDQARQAKDDGAEQRCLEIVGAVVTLVPSAQAAENEQQAQNAEQEGADLTAELKVDQPQPQVTVKQKPPKVTVKIGKPTITVRMPKPEVTVDMPEPEVTIEQQDPEVNVVMAEPDISLADQSDGGDTQQKQAMVSVERDDQAAEVQLEQEEPEVTVEQQEPTVNVTRSEQQAAEDADQARQQGQEDQQSRLTVAGMTPDEIIGRDVVNSRDEEVADIYELVKDANGDRMFAILSVGGFLGLGEKEVAIPLDQFEIRDDGTFVLPQKTEEELESMPHYEPANYVPVQRAG